MEPVTDLSQEPVVLKLRDMLRIYHYSESTAKKLLGQGKFKPRPFLRGPYRWRRADVQADLERRERTKTPLRGKQGRRRK